MLYIIAYDTPSDKRRTKLHKLLCGFGRWTQFSLFECYLSEKELVLLRHKLDKLLDDKTDNVRLYPLCQTCQSKVETIGSPQPHEDTVYLL
ncbi:MAG: CRISPR-associated endonuclease Cas2 [Anaerolineales bacterium]|nr:CRISPR-associated endonuclease Cas2 [Anaerolineales bacterium]